MSKHVAAAGFKGMSLQALITYGQEHGLKMRGRPPLDTKLAKELKTWRDAMRDAGYDGTGTLKAKHETHEKHNLPAHATKAVDAVVENKEGFSLAGPLPKDPAKRAATIAFRQKVKAIRTAGNVPKILGMTEPLPQMSDEELLAFIKEKFDVMRSLITGVVENGAPRALIIAGGGGVGKSYNVQDILDPYKEQGRNITYESGKVTPIQLYKLLWKYRNEGDIVVLDDTGAIFSSEDTVELLKAALDTKAERWISWRSEAGSLAAENVDPKFLYNGTMIFLTNKDMEALKNNGPVKMQPHMEALMTRAVYLDLALHHSRELLLWVNYITRKAGLLIQHGLTKDDQEIALKYLAENREQLREISLRTVIKLGEFMTAHGGAKGHWRKFANHTLLRDYRPKLEPIAAAANQASGTNAAS
jgi:hypothetical protein